MALAKFLQFFLPSYDISQMDLHNPCDKRIIIEAVLNKGTSQDIKWLFRTYGAKEIKKAVKNPSRGCWDARVLNFWTRFFTIKINPTIYEMAILDLNPNLKKQRKWFNFMKKRANKETLKRWKKLGILEAGK